MFESKKAFVSVSSFDRGTLVAERENGTETIGQGDITKYDATYNSQKIKSLRLKSESRVFEDTSCNDVPSRITKNIYPFFLDKISIHKPMLSMTSVIMDLRTFLFRQNLINVCSELLLGKIL